jgi:hypothetical protein
MITTIVMDQFIDPIEVLITNPIEDKAIWRIKRERIVRAICLQGTDPHTKLLRWQL